MGTAWCVRGDAGWESLRTQSYFAGWVLGLIIDDPSVDTVEVRQDIDRLLYNLYRPTSEAFAVVEGFCCDKYRFFEH